MLRVILKRGEVLGDKVFDYERDVRAWQRVDALLDLHRGKGIREVVEGDKIIIDASSYYTPARKVK